jgi:hypothetical protein
MCFKIRDLNISTPIFTLSVLEFHVTLLFSFCSLTLLAVSIKYLTSLKAVEKYMSDIQDISHKFDFITKNGSEKQIFRLIKTLETGLSQSR